MHCKDGRALELSVVVTVAPDFLSSYTKIVRFLPRYVIVNCLPYPVRIWQDNSIFQPLLADHTGTQDKITKWRYSKGEGKRSPSKINQYEALWGRETRLDEREVGRMPNGTAAHGSELYITTVFPAEFIPFSLPDSRDERQLRVDLGNPWSLTASISADIPGDHALKIKRAVDLRVLPHVSTRSNPQYEVRLPPSGGNIFDGELGVWFETEWGTSRNLIVKAVRKYSYAFNETDVHVGDELLAIDGIPVSQMTFVEAMGMLRSRLSEVSSKNVNEISRKRVPMQSRRSVANNRPGQEVFPGEPVIFENKPFVLTFRTLEERRRKVRLKAANAGGERPQTKFNAMIDQENSPYSVLSASDEAKKSNIYIQAELKTLSRSSVGMFLVLRDKADAPFEIHNQAITSTIYYRQRGCNHHVWQSLKPGQSNSYSWDEPLKPKRLMVRVASDWTFDFGDDELRHALPDNIAWSSKFAEADRSSRRRPFRLFKEEDAVFSPSISIRLEEIGYEEFLPIQSLGARKDNKSPVKYLKFEGDVEGGARVLVVKDVSGEQGEHQMTRHLVSLQQKIDDEEKNVKELRSLNVFLAASVEHKLNDEDHRQAEEMTRKLMVNFSEEATITGRHQIIVEVLEAIGLNPESFVGSCNPYAEVWLKSGSPGRTTLFRKKDLRRTYFVRKSLNPTWNAQSFVFAVPCGAESVTRGHSIQVRVRNFCVLGNHQTLGRAQVDLHSVRDQDPLMGWFPLAGRTGRRELENRKSHWGRGSVKLKVQWIYTTPALVQYSLHLSERRLLELQESVVGLTQQLAKKKELEKKKKAGIDGFKAVRVKELSSFSKTNTNLIAAQIRKLKMLSNSGVKRIIEPQPPSEKSGLHASFEEETDGTDIVFFASPVGAEGIRTRLNSSNDVVKKFEDRIYLQRLNFQRLASSRFRVNNKPSTHGDGVFLVSSFKFWASVQAVLSESDFETEFRGDEIKILLRRASPTIHEKEFDMHPDCQNTVEQKLAVPANAPALVRAASESYVAEFFRSRGSVERTARISLKTILHPGGWLSIRPITALNLPDVYTGMFVKVRYGPDTILSETADAKALDPTWCKPDSRAEPEEQLDIMSRNDLHIRITPQKTSGIIRLSIIGERSQQHLHAKTELGVLHLPLGATISACTYRSESCLDCGTDGSSPMLVRWFPLTSPKDAAQEEGDERLNTRPSDSENTSDSLFHEYFAPCIQLALLWTPDLEEKCDDENHESLHSHTVIGRSHSAMGEVATSRVMVSPLLKSYFNAEIGRISVSLIDSQNVCELLSFSAHDIDVRYWVTNAKTRIGVTIGWLQLDYQDDNVREPVVLAPTPSDVLGPVLQTLAVKDNIRSVADILSFDFIDFSIAEFDLTIEERLLSDLFSFFTSVRHKKEVELRARGGWESYEANNAIYEHRSLMKSTSPIDDRSLHSLLATEVCEESSKQSKLYIRQLVLGVVKVNLSYLKGKKSLWEGQRLGRWVDKRFDQVLGVAGAEYMTDNFSASENSDLFLAWSQHTSEDERHSEDDGKFFCHFLFVRVPFSHFRPIENRNRISKPSSAVSDFVSECFRRPHSITKQIVRSFI